MCKQKLQVYLAMESTPWSQFYRFLSETFGKDIVLIVMPGCGVAEISASVRRMPHWKQFVRENPERHKCRYQTSRQLHQPVYLEGDGFTVAR